MPKAVILLSGGLDSTTCLAYAKQQGFECYAISFLYNQRHRAELEAAKVVAQHYQVKKHLVFPLDSAALAGSALTEKDIEVADYSGETVIPATYVPARNTVFLSVGLAWAEALGAYDLFIGASCVDYSGYPDCRPEFFEAFQKMASLATKEGVEGRPITLQTPLLYLSKAQTVLLGLSLGVDYSMTTSCYRLNEKGEACGRCDSCVFRKKGFAEAGVADPTKYY
ncbi:MAG: 7-cyano-7-deazaguanine synthase QueC [Gammaproteobacteria bacterium]|nr:7-cyano-7-deazaguanine synthase QueC [Gammaproteobacteria bacterium]